MTNRLATRIAGFVVALSVTVVVLTTAAGACPLPCVYVRNDNPYVYAQVCPPV